jgi:hypothetical protein
LVDEKNAVVFEMNSAEFQNFYNIIDSFKNLTESPDILAETSAPSTISSKKPKLNRSSPAKPPLMSLDGGSVSLKSDTIKAETDPGLDDSLSSLESLDSGGLDSIDDLVEAIASESKSESESELASTPSSSSLPKMNVPVASSEKLAENPAQNENKLKETDWDPW